MKKLSSLFASFGIAALSTAVAACGSDSFTSGRAQTKEVPKDVPNPEKKEKRQAASSSNTGDKTKANPEVLQEVNSEDLTPLNTEDPGVEGALEDESQIDSHRQFETPLNKVDVNAFIDALFKKPAKLPQNEQQEATASIQDAQTLCTQTSQTVQVAKPMDLVFNIDVSTSMQNYINAVKSNVQDFALRLSAQGVDSRFAAVGFVDRHELSISFSDPATFANQIAGWKTLDLGNTDYQEAGQAGLESALYSLATAGRAEATKVIVHISDAVSFAKDNHNDLKTNVLATAFRNAAGSLGNFLFYSSVPATAAKIGTAFDLKNLSFSPRDQMEGFRAEVGQLKGKSLNFPFSANTLSSELPLEILSHIEERLICM